MGLTLWSRSCLYGSLMPGQSTLWVVLWCDLKLATRCVLVLEPLGRDQGQLMCMHSLGLQSDPQLVATCAGLGGTWERPFCELRLAGTWEPAKCQAWNLLVGTTM